MNSKKPAEDALALGREHRRSSVSSLAHAAAVSSLRGQKTVPTDIPGERKHVTPRESSGENKKKFLNLVNKQRMIIREKNQVESAVKREITKEEILKSERQSKMVKIFFKKDQLDSTASKPQVRSKNNVSASGDKFIDRGSLGFFLDRSNFNQMEAEGQPKQRTLSTASNKYEDVNTGLNTKSTPPNLQFAHSTSRKRVESKSSVTSKRQTQSKGLLPYPQEAKCASSRKVEFNDVWKKVETKDILTHVKSFRINEQDGHVAFPYTQIDNDDVESRNRIETLQLLESNVTNGQTRHLDRRMSSWTCVPDGNTKSLSEMLSSGMNFSHARKSVYSPSFSSRFGVKKVALFDVTPEEEVGFKEEFRSRYGGVLDSMQNESTSPPSPQKPGDIPPLGKVKDKDSIFRTDSEVEEDAAENITNDNNQSVDVLERANCYSPRNAFVRESFSRGLIPFRIREILDVEDVHKVEVIDLKGQGLGDDKMCAVVQSLPYFESAVEIDISDNRLTDASIEPFLNMVLFTLSNVRTIDLSANKMDQVSVTMLNNYLSSETCSLKVLKLNKSDVDDNECANMMDSMTKNKSIQKLYLSNNFIGVNEDLNAVQPEFVTGPEAIAGMLMENDVLVELDVSWNSIRGESAVSLGQSLASNNHLLVLNLSYNSIGDAGGQQIAHSLRFNASLKHLDVSYNHLSPKTALVFSQVLDSTDVLESLNMNGNCPGLIGGRALLRSIRMKALAKKTLKVRLEKANLNFVDNTFDRSSPSGDFELDMDSPYGYAVVCILFEMASTKPDARFVNVMHGQRIERSAKSSKDLDDSDNDEPSHEIKWTKINLVRGPSENDRANEMWANLIKDLVVTQKERDEAAKPKNEKSSNDALAKKLFGGGGTKAISNMMIQKSKRTKEIEKKKENAKDFNALEKICQNFDLFPDDEALEKIAAHFSALPPARKDELHKVVKEIFIASFEVAETYSTSDFRLAVMQLTSNKEKKKMEKKGADDLIDVSQITKVLSLLGWKQLTTMKYQYVAEKILKSLDIFGRGVVCQRDFIRLMFLQFTDSYASSPGPLLDNATGMVWEVPTSGILRIKFYATTMPPSKDALVSEETIKIMTGGDFVPPESAGDKGAPGGRMLHRSSTASRFRKHVPEPKRNKATDKMIAKMATIDEDFAVTADQADVLLTQLMSNNDSSLSHAVETILPQVATPMDACRFLASNLTFEQLMAARDRMDNAFRTTTGISGGHYLMDLSKKYDRAAIKKLNAQCNLEKAKRYGSDVPYLNTSQSGDNENFRNGSVNGKPRTLTTAWLENLPNAGKVRFDYVNTERTVLGVEPISDHMFERIMDEILFCEEYRSRIEKQQQEASERRMSKVLKKKRAAAEAAASQKKKDFAPAPLRRAQSASVLDTEKQIGEEEQQKRNQRLTGKHSLKGTASFDTYKKSIDTEDIAERSDSFESGFFQKRSGIVQRGRKKSVIQPTATDTFRFFNAVKGQESVSRRAQLTFQYQAYWNEVDMTSFENYMTAYRAFLEKMLQSAKDQILAKRDLLSNGAATESLEDVDDKEKAVENLQAMNELKFLHQIALYTLTYRLARIRPYFLSEIVKNKKMAAVAENLTKYLPPTPKSTPKQRLMKKSKKRALLEAAIEQSKEQKLKAADECMQFHDILRAVEVCLVYQVYFSSEQVEKLIKKLRSKKAPMLVIVSLIQLIFSRIVDLTNFGKLVSKFPNDLKDELFHRIGILNVWTPVHPDGSYRLNLSAWDNREAAKMLFKLAAVEPGENLINEAFRPSLIEDNIPGWELPLSWTVEGGGAESILTDPSPYRGDDDFNPLANNCTLDQREGQACRRHGYITFEYTSDPKKGCVPCMGTRRELAKERTLSGYRGLFTNDLANLNQPKRRVKQQRAVRIVGDKLKKLAFFAKKRVAENTAEDSDDSSDDGKAKMVMRARSIAD